MKRHPSLGLHCATETRVLLQENDNPCQESHMDSNRVKGGSLPSACHGFFQQFESDDLNHQC
jgi:hypothetical protein